MSVSKTIAALLIAAAITAPPAGARLIDPPRPPVTHIVNPAGVPRAQSTGSSSGGFHWGDAGIGAAATFTALGLGTGALLVVRRNRDRRPAATS